MIVRKKVLTISRYIIPLKNGVKSVSDATAWAVTVLKYWQIIYTFQIKAILINKPVNKMNPWEWINKWMNYLFSPRFSWWAVKCATGSNSIKMTWLTEGLTPRLQKKSRQVDKEFWTLLSSECGYLCAQSKTILYE